MLTLEPPGLQSASKRLAAYRHPVAIGLLALTLTAFILCGPERNRMNVISAVIVLLHLGLGLLLIVPTGIVLIRRFRAARNRRIVYGVLFCLSVVCALTGLYLVWRALAGFSVLPNAPAWRLHSGAGFTAVGLWVLGRIALTFWRSRAPEPPQEA
ncbi:MAG TPA: hypothetical protein VKU00_03685, partial [Chthonomonadaceae bacterium]|nr:hypothetical protein [Chthonomonadaceae bacterium]